MQLTVPPTRNLHWWSLVSLGATLEANERDQDGQEPVIAKKALEVSVVPGCEHTV